MTEKVIVYPTEGNDSLQLVDVIICEPTV